MNAEADKEIPESRAGMAFRVAMDGKQYGYQETMDAWHWFSCGFLAGWTWIEGGEDA